MIKAASWKLTFEVSLYGDLLSQVMADDAVATRVNRNLVEYVASGGTALEGSRGAAGFDELCAALDYDHALIRLCTIMGARTGTERLDVPGPGRKRLRATLATRGPQWKALLRDAEAWRPAA